MISDPSCLLNPKATYGREQSEPDCKRFGAHGLTSPAQVLRLTAVSLYHSPERLSRGKGKVFRTNVCRSAATPAGATLAGGLGGDRSKAFPPAAGVPPAGRQLRSLRCELLRSELRSVERCCFLRSRSSSRSKAPKSLFPKSLRSRSSAAREREC